MRAGLVIGIGSIVTAFGVGAVHDAYTGDASVLQLVVRSVLYAGLIALMITIRLGVPDQIRALRIRRALGKG